MPEVTWVTTNHVNKGNLWEMYQYFPGLESVISGCAGGQSEVANHCVLEIIQYLGECILELAAKTENSGNSNHSDCYTEDNQSSLPIPLSVIGDNSVLESLSTASIVLGGNGLQDAQLGCDSVSPTAAVSLSRDVSGEIYSMPSGLHMETFDWMTIQSERAADDGCGRDDCLDVISFED
ncbi:hypothetical protein GQ44DRAFT_831594 [Phaeosphaeriaceae sp. PMI808]|nr:hypothetical protein GQ44DRAFT_831594 [Phaeosphaeriaceae sp. PMI808]